MKQYGLLCHRGPSQTILSTNQVPAYSRRSVPYQSKVTGGLRSTTTIILGAALHSRQFVRLYSMASSLPELRPVERLSPRVIRILGGNPNKYTLQGTNTYLVGTGATRLLIDTAQGFPAWRQNLSSVLQSEGCSVSACLLTHWHGDHVRGAPDLLDLCPNVTMHKYPGGPDLDFPNTDAKSTGDETPSEHPIGRPVPVTVPIKDREVFETHGAALRAIHSPGHTVDHCAFVLEEEGEEQVLFSGDAVLGHGTAVFEDLKAYMHSLNVLKAACKSNAKIYPGHGAVVHKGIEKIDEYINHRRQREDEVLNVIRTDGEHRGVTPMDIVKVIYKDYPEALHAPAEGGTRLVLKKLESEGTVAADAEGRWRVKRDTAL